MALSIARHQPFHPVPPVRGLRYFDLRIYRGAAHLVLAGQPLYDTRINGFYFTYPPLAAITFAPLKALSLSDDETISTGVNMILMFAVLAMALRLARSGQTPHSRTRAVDPWLVALLGAGALWLEPISTTLGYGQIDLLIALLVLADLCLRDGSPTKGVLIGVAAGIKLTPLVFVPYLFLTGRRRAAVVSSVVFGATVAIGYLVLPRDASRYWGGIFLEAARVGGRSNAGGGPSNQSLRGLLVRLAPSSAHHPWWVLVGVGVALFGITLAVRASRRGNEAGGYSLCALTGLLVSPISWTHHWVLALPALAILFVRGWESRSNTQVALAGVLTLVAASYSTWFINRTNPVGRGLGVIAWLAADSYVLTGVIVLGLAALSEYRRCRLNASGDTGPAEFRVGLIWMGRR